MIDCTRTDRRGNGVGGAPCLPVGVQLELEVLKALEAWRCEVVQSVELDHLGKVDFHVRACPQLAAVFRPLFLQVTTSGDAGIKAFQFSERARAFDPEPLRVYVEVVSPGPTLNFRRPALHNALYRVWCDLALGEADFLWITLDGLRYQLRAVPPTRAGQRQVGVLHTWMPRPEWRTREFGYVFTPDERQLYAGCRSFHGADALAAVRRDAKTKQRPGAREVVVNLPVSFLEGNVREADHGDAGDIAGAVRKQRFPPALDIRLLETAAAVA